MNRRQNRDKRRTALTTSTQPSAYLCHFDRLGNPIALAPGTRTYLLPPRRLPDWQHRVIQRASVVTIAASLAIMLWGR